MNLSRLSSLRGRRSLGWVVSLVCLVGAIWYIWAPCATRRVDRVVAASARALFYGDGKTLYEFTHPMIRAEMELTPEKCQRLLDEVILPKFQGCKVVEFSKPDMGESGSAFVFVTLVCNGKREVIAVHAGEVSGVGGTFPLTAFLRYLWAWDYWRRHGMKVRHELIPEVEGLRRDLETLEAIGLKGWPTGKGHVVPWREWLAKTERRIAEEGEARSGQK